MVLSDTHPLSPGGSNPSLGLLGNVGERMTEPHPLISFPDLSKLLKPGHHLKSPPLFKHFISPCVC